MEKVLIKSIDHPDHAGMKLKYMDAIEYVTPKAGPDGKVITGLDEFSHEILTIEDPKEKKAKQEEIKKLRTKLEGILNLDLSPSSSFWDRFFVQLTDSDFTLDPNNALDIVKEKFLIANRAVAPSREDIDTDERFMNCIFYLFRETEETTKKAEKQKALDKAIGILATLHAEKPNKLKHVYAYIFGHIDVENVKVDKAYLELRNYLTLKNEKNQKEVLEHKKHIATFTEVCVKDDQEIAIKLLLDKAIKRRVIRAIKNVYRRGDYVLGHSYEATLEYLSAPENSSELLSLKKQLED